MATVYSFVDQFGLKKKTSNSNNALLTNSLVQIWGKKSTNLCWPHIIMVTFECFVVAQGNSGNILNPIICAPQCEKTNNSPSEKSVTFWCFKRKKTGESMFMWLWDTDNLAKLIFRVIKMFFWKRQCKTSMNSWKLNKYIQLNWSHIETAVTFRRRRINIFSASHGHIYVLLSLLAFLIFRHNIAFCRSNAIFSLWRTTHFRHASSLTQVHYVFPHGDIYVTGSILWWWVSLVDSVCN